MGESNRRRQSAAAQLSGVQSAAARIGGALDKLATAASANHGFDCVVHAELGRRLFLDLGFDSKVVVGNAAWRVGPTKDDMIGHMYQFTGRVPPEHEGKPAFPFHAWLMVGDILVDFTTYTLRRKASELDALDGGSTTVEWCPHTLVVPISEVRSFEQTLNAAGSGAFHYQHIPQMQAVILRGLSLDEADVQMAQLILRNPNAAVLGPNNFQ